MHAFNEEKEDEKTVILESFQPLERWNSEIRKFFISNFPCVLEVQNTHPRYLKLSPVTGECCQISFGSISDSSDSISSKETILSMGGKKDENQRPCCWKESKITVFSSFFPPLKELFPWLKSSQMSPILIQNLSDNTLLLPEIILDTLDVCFGRLERKENTKYFFLISKTQRPRGWKRVKSDFG